MPVFMVFLWAIVEFGILYSALQNVSVAAREGVIVASETSLPTSGAVPSNIVNAVEEQLNSAGIVPDNPATEDVYCKLRVEHNVGGTQVELVSPPPQLATPCDCAPSGASDFLGQAGQPAIPPGEYVRVTVCVPLSELAPNLLQVFGFDLDNDGTGNPRIASVSMVMLHE